MAMPKVDPKVCSVVGKNLYRIRNEKNLTRQEAARLAGISTGTLAYYEGGEHLPRPVNLRTLAEVYGVKVADILHGSGATQILPSFRRMVEADRSSAHVQESVAAAQAAAAQAAAAQAAAAVPAVPANGSYSTNPDSLDGALAKMKNRLAAINQEAEALRMAIKVVAEVQTRAQIAASAEAI